MLTLEITDYRTEQRLSSIAKYFGATLHEDCEEYSFKFDGKLGRGSMRGIDFDHGLTLMMIDAVFEQDTRLLTSLGRRHPILFLYSSIGDIQLHTLDDDISHDVKQNEAMIYGPRGAVDYSMTFKRGQAVRCIFVSVVRFLFLDKIECDLGTIPSTLAEMFTDTVGKQSFYFQSPSDPIVLGMINALHEASEIGLEKRLLMEAKSLNLITSMIKTFRLENEDYKSSYRFSKQDISAINKAKSMIMSRLVESPTVAELSKEVGMNSSKLQKGFRLLFDKSIRQFTISLKMHKALHLLDRGAMTISETAHYVGYTNKGHFSQLFKKEFGVLPSEYLARFPRR